MRLVGRSRLLVASGAPGGVGARLLAGAVAAARLAGAARTRPPLELDPSPLAEGSVTVVVPARDEAHAHRPAARVTGARADAHRLVVVDDESTDATAEVARAAGAEVVTGRPVPSGWVGKPWALQQGLAAATTAWVVTLDADTVRGAGAAGGAWCGAARPTAGTS